ncbi:putative adenylyltransferase/sulfurtransferase MoeZ [Planctomycetes bacterium Poly30]|uniref:Putative adenylyltransferase/sulfurtransferase MoeZ n=1 Tax=Saltatorellus ferox TaxID=2528018 RepID=A0A518EX43_9BACT|nr:putative adenylyltransferase/sulfurtransferase MoeZ [Planctomycetes bacterium Poly30]
MTATGPKPISPKELAARLERGDELVLLDVREPGEVAICALPGILHIPLGELSVRLTELDLDAETVCICHHGIRSAHAAAALQQIGFDGQLWNLSGGMDRWSTDVDPSARRY